MTHGFNKDPVVEKAEQYGLKVQEVYKHRGNPVLHPRDLREHCSRAFLVGSLYERERLLDKLKTFNPIASEWLEKNHDL